MEKNYEHQLYEEKLVEAWEKSGKLSPTGTGKPFCIIMPPPNANEALHIGHVMFVTVEDILTRYHRMLGESTLWLPGTDHAGIETQYVFEKKLAKEGKSRFDYDRETLYKMISDYVDEQSGIAIGQMKRVGASADWSRLKFTLDKDIVKEVIETFKKLNDDGLIYRKEKLVNYCTKCGTAYSELEVEYEERTDKLYTIDYGSIKVATTRPETMLGDTAIAVNPTDRRYMKLIGSEVTLPLMERKIPIIGDKMVDKKFGTGAVKITPAHDSADYEVAERHNLPLIKVIGTNGKMTAEAGKYAGLSVTVAREQVLADLGDKLTETKPYTHNVGTCYKCHRAIEPLPLPQFFIKVKPLAEKALTVLNTKETVVFGAGREKILRHWLSNLRDWNISRQIVWGIRIPVWYLNGNKDSYVVSESCPGEGYVQEIDSFDTWFSSGQWPVVTLKTGQSGDFQKYYPTSVMETGYDILPFWVMRMMLLCTYLTDKSPFKYVYLHGLVRDERGQKMSKSKGNAINPLLLIERYGADALRMALVMSTTAGQDSNTGESKVRGMRNFANKIWNATRYVVSCEELRGKRQELRSVDFEKKLESVVKEVTRQLDDLKIGLAAETVYNEFWHWYCDRVIEEYKVGKVTSEELSRGLRTFLRLLHPFVPFVTEICWRELGNEEMLMSYGWPEK